MGFHAETPQSKDNNDYNLSLKAQTLPFFYFFSPFSFRATPLVRKASPWRNLKKIKRYMHTASLLI